MAFSFADIANTKVEEVTRPPNPPIGHYIFQITKVPTEEVSKDDKWLTISYPCVAVAGVDIDADALQEYGELKNIRQSVRFMFNREDDTAAQATLFRMRTFLDQHVKCTEDGMTMKQAMNAAVNNRFIGELAWRPDKNTPEIIYTEIRKTAPVA